MSASGQLLSLATRQTVGTPRSPLNGGSTQQKQACNRFGAVRSVEAKRGANVSSGGRPFTRRILSAVLVRGRQTVPVGESPIVAVVAERYLAAMNPLLLIIVLLLLFGGGGFYVGGPAFGGGGIGLILLVCLVIYLMGGWRTKN